MSNHKIDRINESVQREMADIMRGIKDPRVTGMLTVVRAEVSGDLSVAKIYISSVEGEENTKSAVAALQKASGYIRTQLASRLGIRKTPELKFIVDTSAEYSFELEKKLKDVL